jgi:hypothetical protein
MTRVKSYADATRRFPNLSTHYFRFRLNACTKFDCKESVRIIDMTHRDVVSLDVEQKRLTRPTLANALMKALSLEQLLKKEE